MRIDAHAAVPRRRSRSPPGAAGSGPRWAERRTDLRGRRGQACAEAVAIWVHVDPDDAASPLPIPAGFDERWGATANGRRVRADTAPSGAARRTRSRARGRCGRPTSTCSTTSTTRRTGRRSRRSSRGAGSPQVLATRRSSSAVASTATTRSSAATPTSTTASLRGAASAVTCARRALVALPRHEVRRLSHDVVDARRGPGARVPDGEGRHDARRLSRCR